MLILSYIHIFVAPYTVACQAPLPMEFSRQEYWNELPFHTLGDLPQPGIEPEPPVFPTLADEFFNHCATWETPIFRIYLHYNR